MYSQQWLNGTVWYSPHHENAIWWHWFVVVVPRTFSSELEHKAFLQIEAGRNSNAPPDPETNGNILELKALSLYGGFVTSMIFQVPNQPIHFYDDWWFSDGEVCK